VRIVSSTQTSLLVCLLGGDFELNKAVSTVTALCLIAALLFLGWWLEIDFTNDMGKWMMSWVQ